MTENGDNIICKKCNNRVKFNITKLLSTFPDILIFTLDRRSFDKEKLKNVIDDSPIQINETRKNVYKHVVAVGGIGSESAQYDHFISYIIEPDAVTKIDDTKIKKYRLSILDTDKFQRALFIAVNQKQTSLFLKKKKRISGVFLMKH